MESHLGPLCGAETQIDGEGTLHGGVGGRGKSSTGLRELQVVLSLQEAEGASCSQPDAAGREAWIPRAELTGDFTLCNGA